MANEDGFLSRWSRRKADVREGRPVDEPPASVDKAGAPVSVTSTPVAVTPDTTSPQTAPTLADVQQLTTDSDFSGFMARGVAPDVKNAAMKKLFADPHFNVMDRMDIYIDDYTQADPLPLAMLRQMTSAQTLNLFQEETQPVLPSQVVAQSTSAQNPNLESSTHDHADLRLQPDPTSRPEDSEPEPV
jgi:hypothetical protein